ncbi:E3 ubiquitin-protein ligase RNF138 [Bombina bombina]|uniref:E3 ubiquitin-protein ligase RNF138 n=1 Tax=Bombina bombina TaxID=8345 RepID=UPI00235ABF81|nr:E3 ubiquitin-protein ligase RNF138 [Bombina bombina]
MASTSLVSDQHEDFYCPVCQEIFQTPVRTQACEHVFCRKCFIMAMKSGGAHCPLCRGSVNKRERLTPTRAYDIETKMSNVSGSCSYCEKQLKLSYMRLHYKSCKKYQEEYGFLPKDPIVQTYPQITERHNTTYKCPLCPQQDMNRSTLLEHCNSLHYFQVVEMVCPICSTLPWGNPNETTANVVDHLNARHQFDYADFMNFVLDEDAQFQAAIVKSFQTCL